MSDTQPLVSFVIPNHNEERYIAAALESILAQTYTNFECIVVDDGSSDKSPEILKEYAARDSRIKILTNEKNLRICKTLNRGIEAARGKYIVRMDGDDICYPTRLERQVQFMEDPQNKNVGVCGSYVDIIDKNGDVIGAKQFPTADLEIRKAFWFRNPLQHSTTIIRKECFDTFGMYDDNFVYVEDLELWMRFGQKFELRNIPERLVQYRLHGENAVIVHQKPMIRNILKLRSKTAKNYGYKMNSAARVSFMAVLIAYILPPSFVLKIFTWLSRSDEGLSH